MSESKEYAELENGNIKNNGTIITVTQDNGETTVKMTEGNSTSSIVDDIKLNTIISDNENDISQAANEDAKIDIVYNKYIDGMEQNDIPSDLRDKIKEKMQVLGGGKAKRSKKSAKKGKKSRGMKGKRGRRSAKKGRK